MSAVVLSRRHERICVARAVRHVRRRRGLSRRRLAHESGMPYRRLLALEFGLIEPTTTHLAHVSVGLDLLPMVLRQAILNEDYLIEIGGARQLLRS
jgi:transcriptional regulator with XRE-family HTH domain